MMACLSSGRLCIRGFEKLCFLSQNSQLKRKSAAYVRVKEIGIQPIARTLVQNCQVSQAILRENFFKVLPLFQTF